MRSFAFSCFVLALVFAGAAPLPARETAASDPKGEAVIREMNLARQQPNLYADILETRRGNFRGSVFLQENGSLLRTREGVGGLDEAIRFLRHAQPLPPLNASTGMAQAAAEHVIDQAGGAFGHGGSDRSNPGARLNRHGAWVGTWGENISYGKSSAREIVVALIIDDGQRARKHRQNIFNPAFNVAGASVGPHSRYHSVCSIDFAGGYTERGSLASAALFAGN